MSGARNVVLIVGIALLPLCSIQHFIWPLSWCLLADICNHTWIPECGYDELLDAYRLFIDECDMFEYNCDHETDYEVTNYSLCFGHVICPKPKPCPSRPTCPDHRYHRMGDRYVFLNPRRQGRRMNDLGGSTLPMKMMQGKRRYTPEKKKRINRTRMHYDLRTRHTTPIRTRPKGPPTKRTWPAKTVSTVSTTAKMTEPANSKPITSTLSTKNGTTQRIKFNDKGVILKRVTIRRNGKIIVKLVRAVHKSRIAEYGNVHNRVDDSDFIE